MSELSGIDLKQRLDRIVEHLQAGKMAIAREFCLEILPEVHEEPGVLHILGMLLLQTGDTALAIRCVDRAIAIQGTNPTYYVSRGKIHRSQGDMESAITCFKRAIEMNPALADAYASLGDAYGAAGCFDQAILALDKARSLQPDNPNYLHVLGLIYMEVYRWDEAIDCFRHAIQLQPECSDAYNRLGCALRDQGRLEESKTCFQAATQLNPRNDVAFKNMGSTCMDQGLIAEALSHFRTALSIHPDAKTHSNLLLALNYRCLPADEVFAEHRLWNRLYAEPLKSSWVTWKNTPDPERCLRIGYVSPNFLTHSVAFFIEAPLAFHDHANYQIYCYSDVRVPDQTTQRLRKHADVWREISNLSDEKVADLVRSDQIDILVDLTGHTDKIRLGVFARKPAPIQVTWIGYPNTTGLSAIDYRLTDHIADPPGQTERYYSEKLVRLPHNFSCFSPPDSSPEISLLPALSQGYVTFGCFNKFSKVTDRILQVWAQILNSIPHARLMVKTKSLGDAGTVQRLVERLSLYGVGREKLLLDSYKKSTEEHLAQYSRVDIALDTFPYNGTTTTCEALWMGVPVITWAGSTHVARVGASLLSNLGVAEWIATSPEDYVACAVNLSRDLNALASLRAGLRTKMRQSSLCDGLGFTRDLEATFRWMWRQYAGKKD